MAFSLFGFKLIRDTPEGEVQTFAQPEITDDIGEAKQIPGMTSEFGILSAFANNNGNISIQESENNLISQYREIARNPEVDKAIEEIVSESIIVDEKSQSVKLDLADVELSEPIKEKMHESFKKTLRLLNFNQKGFDIFRRWYIDGRINYHIIIDEKNIKRGVVQLRYVDPKKIKRIRTQIVNNDTKEVSWVEYYEFSETGIDTQQSIQQPQKQQTIKISTDSIAHANSGLTNSKNNIIISYLDKAIAPANKLRSLENSMVIYRLVRAPERRLIYVDVGGLPKHRADQYMQSVVGKYKTKITYDTVTGKIRDDRNIMALTEDYFLPRINGSKATEFDTLSSQGTNAGAVDEIEYTKKQLLEALNVPVSRLESSMFSMGRNNEISRDEARFSKFINRLRMKFNDLFDSILSRDLILTGVMSIEDWDKIKQDIHYDYLQDNYFTELVESDILANRIGVLQQIEPYIGIHYSNEYVRKNILRQTDEEIKQIQKQIKKEKASNPDAHTNADIFNQTELASRMNNIDLDKHSIQTDIDTQATKEINAHQAQVSQSADEDNQPNPFRKTA